MEYAAQGQGAKALGQFIPSGGIVGAKREETLMERLTRASDSIDSQCQNINLLLCRLNGNPPAPEQTINKAQPQGARSLVSLVASAEGQANHLRELVAALEKIG